MTSPHPHGAGTVSRTRPTFGPPASAAGPRGPVRPGMGTGEKALSFGPSLGRLLRHLRRHRVPLFAAVIMIIIGTALSALGPAILGRATDLVFNAVVRDREPIDFTAVGGVLLLALTVYAGYFVLSGAAALIVNRVVQRAVYRLRRQVSEKLERLPLSYFDGQPRGELLSRVTNDVDNVSQSLQQTLSQIIGNIFTLLSVMVMMFVVSWQLAIVALVTIPLALALTVVIGRRSQRLFVRTWRATGELNSQIEEAYTGHDLVTVFGRRPEVRAAFAAKNRELTEAAFGAQFISGIIMPVMFFIGNLNYVAIAVLGGLMVAGGSLGVGAIQAFVQYSRQFTHPITGLASMANLLQSGVASAERVFEVLDAPEESPDGSGKLPHAVRGRVVFENVTFGYRDTEPLITGLNLTAEPGSTIAIVGPTGAGKTTLVNLILRFYDLQGGRITIDGVNIATVPRRDLRAHLGMVLQDTWLFGGSIRDNIGYGRVGARPEEIVAAAEASYADRFIRTLPDGYDTQINDDATNLSAGEKQLLTIARAFLANPDILILDEATSSVDTRTEVLVQEAMAKLRARRTSFVIAHRLSTIRDADVILVMEHGQIVEQGDHESLLAANGAYARLYASQFRAGTGDDEEAELGFDPGARSGSPRT